MTADIKTIRYWRSKILKSLKGSDTLRILKNNPGTFKGQKCMELITEEADGAIYSLLCKATEDAGTMLEERNNSSGQ